MGVLQDTASGADLLITTETWTTPGADAPDLPDHKTISCSRPSQASQGRPSGGLACFVRLSLARYVSTWKVASDASLLWLKLDRSLGLERDLYLCAAYVAPRTSSHYEKDGSIDTFDQLICDIAEAQGLGDVLLAGDFNARTGQGADFVEAGLLGQTPEGDLPQPALPTGLHLRQSQDTGAISPFGRCLLELCCATSMLIVNGRVTGDRLGKLTFPHPQGGSVVDYFIASYALFASHPCLIVGDTLPESDHRPLHLYLRLPCPPPLPIPQHLHLIQKLRHRPQCVPQYRDELAAQLSTTCPADNPAEWLQACIVTSATSTHGVQSSSQRPQASKPWFDAECWQARRALRTASHAASVHHNQSPLLASYKALLRRKRRAWEKRNNEDLCQLAVKDPGKFWRKYQKLEEAPQGISTSAWYQAFSSLLAPEAPPSAASAPIMGVGAPAPIQGSPSDHLHDPICATEITQALKRLRRNRASGNDGIRAEHLLDARALLLEPMVHIFTHLLLVGAPECLCRGVIHPIFKAGPRDEPSNYRGITVTPVLAKLFAMILEARLSKWAESAGIRANGQAGFRKGHRTVDHVFTLRTLISQAKHCKRKLFCCFVDFKKAFDSVPRDRLWQVLVGLGLAGPLLQCLQSMYAQDSACVLTQDGCTEFFPCTAGVKQGCPASPLLFGLYLDALETYLAGQGTDMHGAPDGPVLAGQVILLLLFADDLVLVSQSEKGLQSQLNALHAFCENRGLTVNLAKTKAVVFNQRTYKANLVFAGRTVEQVDRYKYLGLVMHQNGSFTCAVESLESAAQRALFALQARCTELGIMDIQLRCRLYDAVVKPVLSYGCEVWMPLVSESSLEELERVHLSFLRRLLDVPRMSSAKHMYAETGRLPHRIFWWQQSIKYMHHLTSLNPTQLVHRAFTVDCMQELWWGQAVRVRLSPLWVTLSPGAEFNPEFSCAALATAAETALMTPSPSNNLDRVYYSFKTTFEMEPYLSELHRGPQLTTLVRFRLGQHWLYTRIGRFGPQRVPYDSRWCQYCALSAQRLVVDSEEHAIFHCPLYADIRQQQPWAQHQDCCNLQAFMRLPSLQQARFLHACYECHLGMV